MSRASSTKKPTIANGAPLAEGENESPLDYCLRIMRDKTCDNKRRDAMALKALPYLHKELKGDKTARDGEQQRVAVRKFSEPKK